MAQTIPYNKLPIPELAPTLSEIAPPFTTMRRLRLPGILIPDVGPDESTAIDTLRSILAALGVAIHRKADLVQSRGGDGDQPLHIDAIPSDEASVGAVLQYTRAGAADILIAQLADPFCAELSQRNANLTPNNYNYDLPPGTKDLLNEGLVDPDVLHPDVYIGSVATGGVAMFTIGGPNPNAHLLTTTTLEREAQGYIVPFTRL